MNCMLLAAGLGTRLRPVTDKIPKPAVELLNVPLFLYSAALLRDLKPDTLVLNVHRGEERLRELAAATGFHWEISRETAAPLGSGGGVKQAETWLRGDTLIVMNADNVVIPSTGGLLRNLLEAHRSAGDPLAILLTVRDPRVGTEFNGLWFDSEGQLREVGKTPVAGGLEGRHFTGIAVYSPRIFDCLPSGESSIFTHGLLPAIARGDRVLRFEEDLLWFETGDAKSFLATTGELLSRFEASEYLRDLIRRHSPDSIFRREDSGTFLISKSASVAPGVKLKGFVVIGAGTSIPDGCSLENCVILPGVICTPGTAIRNQITV